MNVYHHIEEVPYMGNAIATMGNFDGVHLGHAHILESLVAQQKFGFQSMVITFWPHPRKVLNESLEMYFLTSPEEKIMLIQNIGIQHLLILPFTSAFAEMTAREFVKDILKDKIGVSRIVLGYDHRFGRNREGGIEFLSNISAEFGFELDEIPKKEVDQAGISSSLIRENLENGNVLEAKSLLGRFYSLSGVVIEGNKLGRTIGFPTANLSLIFAEKLIPKRGVYAVLVKVGNQKYGGMMNIGTRPTVSGQNLSLEVNIFELDEDLYGKIISVEFVQYLRQEQKFSSLDTLKGQLQNDKTEAITVLKKHLYDKQSS